jgi:hypothetical protein
MLSTHRHHRLQALFIFRLILILKLIKLAAALLARRVLLLLGVLPIKLVVIRHTRRTPAATATASIGSRLQGTGGGGGEFHSSLGKQYKRLCTHGRAI